MSGTWASAGIKTGVQNSHFGTALNYIKSRQLGNLTSRREGGRPLSPLPDTNGQEIVEIILMIDTENISECRLINSTISD